MQISQNQAELNIESPETISFSNEQKRLLRFVALSLFLHFSVWASLTFLGYSKGRFNSSPVINVDLSELPAAPSAQKPVFEEFVETSSPEEQVVETESRNEAPDESAALEEQKNQNPPQDDAPNISTSISFGAFASFGDGLSLKDDLRPYFLDMLERANRAWNIESGGKKLWRGAMLLLTLERNGAVADVRILQSSGNVLNDRLLITALKKGNYAPLPDSYGKDTFEAPVRFNPPLSLLSLDSFFSKPPPH